MPEITSIDALIDRVKIAYPHWDQAIVRIREYMEAGKRNHVFDMINRDYTSSGYTFYANQILELLDDDGDVIKEKLDEMVEKAKKFVKNQEMQPIRDQLADDFQETYPEVFYAD